LRCFERRHNFTGFLTQFNTLEYDFLAPNINRHMI
jgi:hypothetical protein